jgi:hypothetical protein
LRAARVNTDPEDNGDDAATAEDDRDDAQQNTNASTAAENDSHAAKVEYCESPASSAEVASGAEGEAVSIYSTSILTNSSA